MSVSRWLKVQNYVGVIQMPGLTIKILPKVSGPTQAIYDPPAAARELGGWKQAQRNLLYMLSVAGNIPFEDRELANLHTHKLPLLEALILAFAKRLQRELRRGLARAYVQREENLSVVRGKILTSINTKLNAVRRDRHPKSAQPGAPLASPVHQQTVVLALDLTPAGFTGQEEIIELVVRGPRSEVEQLQRIGQALSLKDKTLHRGAQGL
jgi:hypothetical protein